MNSISKQEPRITLEWDKWLVDYDLVTEYLFKKDYLIYPLVFTTDAEDRDIPYRVGNITLYQDFFRGDDSTFNGDDYQDAYINYLKIFNTARELEPFYILQSKYLNKYNTYTLDNVDIEVSPGINVEAELRSFYAVDGHIYTMYILWTIAAKSYRVAGNFSDKTLIDFIVRQIKKNIVSDYRFEKYYLKRAIDRGIFNEDEIDRIKSLLYITTADEYFKDSKYIVEKKGWVFTEKPKIKLDIISTDLIADFYKYISFDMLMSPSYDANNILINGLLCNRLVINYNTPGFTLTYGGFKTLVDITMEEDKTLFSDLYHNLIEYESFSGYDPTTLAEEFRIPLQHVLSEYAPLTLKSLIDDDYFNVRHHLLDTIVDRYYDLFWQIISTLYSAQKLLGFTHNNLISENIVVQPFEGPVTYCIPKEHIELKDRSGKDIFPADDDGDAVFENTPQVGLFKITNFDQAGSLKFSQGSLTPYYIAQKNDYIQTINDRENDVLTIFVDVFDFKFYECLQDRVQKGDKNPKLLDLYELFRTIGNCSLKKKNKLSHLLSSKLRRICRAMDSTCGRGRSMALFNENNCEDSISPENLLIYFRDLVKKDLWIGNEYCFRLLGI